MRKSWYSFLISLALISTGCEELKSSTSVPTWTPPINQVVLEAFQREMHPLITKAYTSNETGSVTFVLNPELLEALPWRAQLLLFDGFVRHPSIWDKINVNTVVFMTSGIDPADMMVCRIQKVKIKKFGVIPREDWVMFPLGRLKQQATQS